MMTPCSWWKEGGREGGREGGEGGTYNAVVVEGGETVAHKGWSLSECSQH